MTCERWTPSSLIFATITQSTGTGAWAAASRMASAVAAIAKRFGMVTRTLLMGRSVAGKLPCPHASLPT